jgi:PH (Pleckstrin Homology) domain-containing protein
VDDEGVTTRSIARTRRYRFDDLRAVEVAVGRTGMNASDRQYLVIHRREGADVRFTALNCRPPKQAGEQTTVSKAAECVDAYLHGR